MSKPKTYTLELTAEELEDPQWDWVRGRPTFRDSVTRLQDLREQARADRERDAMELPWSAQHPGGAWEFVTGSRFRFWHASERMVKLMSAAPELLEAVQAAKDLIDSWERGAKICYHARLVSTTQRALRKVETGVPE